MNILKAFDIITTNQMKQQAQLIILLQEKAKENEMRLMLSEDTLKKVFTEWESRVRDGSVTFQTDDNRLKETIKEVGEGSAKYFIELYNEIQDITK